ncbi:DUF7660 family protein [Nonomuraea endophytica]
MGESAPRSASWKHGHATEADAVRSRQDLVQFVQTLHQELISSADWENDTLDRFLEALAAWIEGAPPEFYESTEQPEPKASWSFMAHALEAATMYEEPCPFTERSTGTQGDTEAIDRHLARSAFPQPSAQAVGSCPGARSARFLKSLRYPVSRSQRRTRRHEERYTGGTLVTLTALNIMMLTRLPDRLTPYSLTPFESYWRLRSRR